MRCEEVRTLLSLDDETARCDGTDLAVHLDGCVACRETAPEVSELLTVLAAGDGPGPLPMLRLPARRSWPKAVAAAAAAALVLAAAWVWIGRESSPPVGPDRPGRGAAPARRLPLPPDAIVHSVIVHERGRRFEARVSEGIWRAPLPRHLESKESMR